MQPIPNLQNTQSDIDVPFFDHCFDKNRLKNWLTKIYYETLLTEDLTVLNFVETLKILGFQEATKAGVSIGIDDLTIPPKKKVLLKQIDQEVEFKNADFAMNRLTALENFQSFIDTWHQTSELIKLEVVANFERTDTLNPVYMMAFSGARGNLSQVSQLVGMRGFMSDPEGQIIDYPIRSNFREGLTLTEYVISCYGARKGLVDTALRTADAGYLTRRLVDVAHSVIITKFDCKTRQGFWVSAIKDNSKTLCSLEKRLVGRVLAEDVYFPYLDPETNTTKAIQWPYFKRNQQLDSGRAKLLASCFNRVLIRSSLRCRKKKRLCQLCYGWTLPHAHLAPIGEAVGILAAQSIGEPGTQLTMRTFHTGGVFSGALSDEIQAPYSGQIKYDKVIQGSLFRTANGRIAFRTAGPGILQIEPLQQQSCLSSLRETTETPNFELEFPTSSVLFFKNFEQVKHGDLLIELPKSANTSKETVLNTYKYYSKTAGFLEVQQRTINPYSGMRRKSDSTEGSTVDELAPIHPYILNEETRTKNDWEYAVYAGIDKQPGLYGHPKLPKIQPFYERAEYILPGTRSIRIYSGQVIRGPRIQALLPKPGDLINTNSIIYRSQLAYQTQTLIAREASHSRSEARSKELASSKETAFPIDLSRLTATKRLLSLSLLDFQYRQGVGYIAQLTKSHLTTDFQVILPALTENVKHGNLNIQIRQSNSIVPVGGKSFYPLAFLNLRHQQKNGFSQNLEEIFWKRLTQIKYQQKLNALASVFDSEASRDLFGNLVNSDTLSRLNHRMNETYTRIKTDSTKQSIYPSGSPSVLSFNLPQPTYQTFRLQTQKFQSRKRQSPGRKLRPSGGDRPRVNQKTIFGQTLSPYFVRKSNQISPQIDRKNSIQSLCFCLRQSNGDQAGSNFVNMHHWTFKNTPIATRFNLQQNNQYAYANNDGFLVIKPTKPTHDLSKDILINNGRRKLGKSGARFASWDVQVKVQFKKGWPVCKLTNTKLIPEHKQFLFFAQSVINGTNLSFDNRAVYTEYISQPKRSAYALKTLQKCLKQLTRSTRSARGKLNLFTQTYCILFIQPASENSLTKFTLNNQQKIYKSLLIKEPQFDQFKRIPKNRANLSKTAKQALTQRSWTSQLASIPGSYLFMQINKVKPTFDNVETLTEQATWFQFQVFLKQLIPPILGSLCFASRNKIHPTAVYEQNSRRRQVLMQFVLKLCSNKTFSAISGTLTPSLTRGYSYAFVQSLAKQNYFKTGAWNANRMYTKKVHSSILNPVELSKSVTPEANISSTIAAIESHFVSPYSGEVILTKHEKTTINSLILTPTNTWTIAMPANGLLRKFQIGDIVHYGLELTPGYSSPYTGQIIQITPTHVKIQQVENSLIGSNAKIFCSNGQFIERTTQLFAQSYPRLQMGDIVQGIPKIEEFFEARRTKDGMPFANNLHARLRKRFFYYKGPCHYPGFIAVRKSIADIQNYIIDSVFQLYNSQGIDISDKHLEIIVRQMTAKVRVTAFWQLHRSLVPYKHPIPSELYSRRGIERYQSRKRNPYRHNVYYFPKVLGITRAALANDGFISAASFQETTRMLSRGSIYGKKDYLKGLKENVILGHIIPAGTAVRTRSRRLPKPDMYQEIGKLAFQICSINYEWQMGFVDPTKQELSDQYFNTLRDKHDVLRILCMSYFHYL